MAQSYEQETPKLAQSGRSGGCRESWPKTPLSAYRPYSRLPFHNPVGSGLPVNRSQFLISDKLKQPPARKDQRHRAGVFNSEWTRGTYGRKQTSVLGGRLFQMIDHDRIHWNLTRLELQAELLHGLKDGRSRGVGRGSRVPCSGSTARPAGKTTKAAGKSPGGEARKAARCLHAEWPWFGCSLRY